MKKSDTEQIEKYLDGNMNPAELEEFEAQIPINPSLKHKLQLQQLIRDGIRGNFIENLRDDISIWEKKYEEKDNNIEREIIPMWVKWAAIAASILIFCIIGVRWYANNNYSNQNIIAHHYIEFNSESRSEDQLKSFRNTINVDVNDCESAIPILSSIPNTGENYVYAQTYLGECFMKAKDFSGAINAFQSALSYHQEDMELSVDLYWNFLLANIGIGKSTEEMEILFQKVPKDATKKFIDEDIDYLRNKLNSFWRKFTN